MFSKPKNSFICLLALAVLMETGSIDPLPAQALVSFEHITTENGLSQSDINCIYQDKLGYMWFGTHDGLNKFDGYGFTVYKPDVNNPASINSNLIFNIVGDAQDNLWIGTTGSGLNFFDRSTETFVQHKYQKDNPKSLSNDHVTAVHLDTKNRLWVGTNDGVCMLDLNEGNENSDFQRFNPDTDPFITGWDGNSIFAIYEDSKGHLWVGGHGGLHRLSRDKNGDVYFQRVTDHIGLPSVTVRCITEDRFGKLIIGTEDGLYYQSENVETSRIVKLANGNYLDVKVDNQNNIWAGTDSGLLYFEQTSRGETPKIINQFKYDPRNPKSLSKDIVISLLVDRTGIIWVGTNGGGINKFDPHRKRFQHIKKTSDPNSLSYDKIRVMYEDSNGTLWIGTEGGGLNRLIEKNEVGNYACFQHFTQVLKPFAIEEIAYNNRKYLLIGAENSPGLFQLDITDPNESDPVNITAYSSFTSSVFTILKDSKGVVWIGTYGGGVFRWNLNTFSDSVVMDAFTYDATNTSSISSNIIRNIYEDKLGNLWFATAEGLDQLIPEQQTKEEPSFVVYKNIPGDTSSLSHNYIMSIHESDRGDLWIGTFGGGLNKYLPSKDSNTARFVSYAEADGLPNSVVKGILEDVDGNLWLSTNMGLSQFNPVLEQFKNYDVNDGLQSNEFQELAFLQRKDGEMLFGGINGFNAFYPETIKDNTFESETVVKSMSITNEPVGIGEKIHGRVILNKSLSNTDQIELKYRENSFSFEFAALHYAAPRKNRFAYMLEGFDKEWVYTNWDKRFATYTNISPGNYTFRVKTSNNDGLWDQSPTELSIRVIPPIWRTDVAYVLYGLLALGLLGAFRRYAIIRTTEKHELELEHLENERLEEVQRIKLDFFTNISHEFRTPLTLIKGPLEYLQKHGKGLDDNGVNEQYALIHKNTNYLLRLVNQLLDFRKLDQGKMKLFIHQGDVVEFIHEIIDPFQFFANKKNINYKITSTSPAINAWFDSDALEKILNNLLSNAFKFTPDNGNVSVEISPGQSHKVLEDATSGLIDCVIIKVKDSGSGIPENKLDDIFKKFYVETNKRGQNTEGMGIGLSFTKSLVELHQGRIAVESKAGQGATFIVTLPKNKEAYLNIPGLNCIVDPHDGVYVHTATKDVHAIAINDEIVDRNFSKTRSKLPIILVIDDNADIRTFIKQSLTDSYTIHEAENGQQGLDLAQRVMPNIILSDVLMPIMDGIEFCERIKTNERTSHIPVVMLTAKSSQKSELEALRTGADDYLTKPFQMELLQVKLANILAHRAELRKRFTRNIVLKPSEVTVTSTDEKFLHQAIETVEKHMTDTDFSVEMLVKEMGLSRSNLYLKFKELTGLSSSEFIRNVRLKRAVQLLETSDLTVKEIMYKTGFNTASYFAKCFKKQFGMIPSEYVRQTNEIKKTV